MTRMLNDKQRELLEYLNARRDRHNSLKTIARDLKREGKSVGGLVACLEPWKLLTRVTMDGSCYARITVQGQMALEAGSYDVQ